VIEDIWGKGRLPAGKASVIFKVPNKEAGRKLLQEIWVNGNRFKAETFIPERADALYGNCSKWGHTDFRCCERVPRCATCAGDHHTFLHTCEVATCGRTGGRACVHSKLRCPNCGGPYFAQDGRCRVKREAIAIARGIIKLAYQVHEMVTSGIAPPMKQ